MNTGVGRLIAGVAATVLVAAVSAETIGHHVLPSRSSRAQVAPPPSSADKPGTAVILGRVVEDGSNTPVANSSVCLWTTLSTGDVTQYCEQTDEKGRFLYRNVRAGSYRLLAEPGGFARGAYGQTRTEGPSRLLEVADGARLMDVTISVYRPAAISGIVLDEVGEPVVGVTVEAALRRPSVRPVGKLIYGFAGPTVQTDDRGWYRIPVGAGGDFVVIVPSAVFAAVTPGADPSAPLIQRTSSSPNPKDTTGPALLLGDLLLRLASGDRPASFPPPAEPGNTMLVYPTAFYPSAADLAQATLVHVDPGEERRGIDLHLPLVRGVRISGHVTNPAGSAQGLTVRLTPKYARDIFILDSLESALATTDAAGHFILPGVPIGEYVLTTLQTSLGSAAAAGASVEAGDGRALPMAAPAATRFSENTLWASNTLVISDRDIENIDLTMRLGLRVTGEVRFEGANQPPPSTVARMSVTLSSVDGVLPPLGVANPQNGRFVTPRYPAGRYDLSVSAPAGWVLRSVMWRGVDVANRVLDLDGEDLENVVVTFTDKLSSIAGTVRGDGGPDAGALVVAFPADFRSLPQYANGTWFKAARVGTDGSYELTALRSTEYFVAAIDEKQSAGWLAPEFLNKLATLASRVTITDGARLTADLRRVTPR